MAQDADDVRITRTTVITKAALQRMSREQLDQVIREESDLTRCEVGRLAYETWDLLHSKGTT